MEKVCLGKLGETITAYLSHPEAAMPLVLAGKPGIGKTEVIKKTLGSMCLRHRDLWELLDHEPDKMDDVDVVLVHTLDPDRVRLDLGSAVSFQSRFDIPVIVSTPVVDESDPVWKQFEGKVIPVFCQQIFEKFAVWAEDT